MGEPGSPCYEKPSWSLTARPCASRTARAQGAVNRKCANDLESLCFLCSKQRSKEVSKLVLAGEKTQNAQTTEFSKILLNTNFANMLDSLSDLGNLVPRLETVPESHVIPNAPWACGDNEKISPCFPHLPAKPSGGIPRAHPKDASWSGRASAPPSRTLQRSGG